MRRRVTVWMIALGALGLLTPAALAADPCEQTVCFQGAVVNGSRVKPHTLWLSADGTLTVVRIRWTRWGGEVAVGHGTAYYHGCTPTCAQAPTHHAAVTVRLSQTLACDPTKTNPNGLYYDRVRLILRSGKDLDGRRLRSQDWAPCMFG